MWFWLAAEALADTQQRSVGLGVYTEAGFYSVSFLLWLAKIRQVFRSIFVSPHSVSFRYYNLEKCEHNLLWPYFLENSLKSWVSLLAQGIYIYTRSRKRKHPSTIFLSSSLTKWAEVLYLLYWIMCHLPLKCQSRLFWIPKWLHRSFSARWYGRRSL